MTPQDRKDLVYLAGQALCGILSDHNHHKQFKGMNCAQSAGQWACYYAYDTLSRLKTQKRKLPSFFPENVKNYR